MKIAIEGCCHGELDKIYEVMMKAEANEGIKIDLLICCGDFQAVRDMKDLNCMAVSPKYRFMQTFHKYYSGEKKAPVLTIFIGGNHEASNHLWELGFGGWVAPNIYYLGYCGVVRYGGIRIAGLSGIYKDNDYRKSHFERPPYDQSTMRSAYHVRSCDLFQMKQLSGKFDIFLSHDWPEGIYEYGDKYLLLRLKPFFAEDMQNNCLGSPPAMELLKLHRPSYWFSGHLHVKFAALYDHSFKNPSRVVRTLQDNTIRRMAPPPFNIPSPQASVLPPQQRYAERDNYGGTDFTKDDDGSGGVVDVKKESEVAVDEGTKVTSVVEGDEGTKVASVEGAVDADTKVTSVEGPVDEGVEADKKEEGVEKEKERSVEDVKTDSNFEIVSKTESKTEAESAPTSADDANSSEVKPEVNPEVTAEVVPEVTAEIKPAEVTVEVKPEVNPEVTVEVKTEVKADAAATGLQQYTKFLSLDKPMPRKRFLQILDIYSATSEVMTMEIPYRLEYDAEWLAILKSTQPLMSYENKMWLPPHSLTDTRMDFKPTEEELKEVRDIFADEEFNGRLVIPDNFVQTVPTYVEGAESEDKVIRARLNPQTMEFCEKLSINNPFQPGEEEVEPSSTSVSNPDEINLSEEIGSPNTTTPLESDETKQSLGDGLLQYSIDNQTSKSALSLPPPIHTPDDANSVTMDTDDGPSQTSSGIKRALPVSPSNVSCDPGGDDVIGGDEAGGPVIKRRNVALYTEKEEEEEEEEEDKENV